MILNEQTIKETRIESCREAKKSNATRRKQKKTTITKCRSKYLITKNDIYKKKAEYKVRGDREMERIHSLLGQKKNTVKLIILYNTRMRKRSLNTTN